MERDPVRYVWQSAPGLNVCLVALAVLAIPGLWIVLDLLRTAIDDAALGRAFGGRPTAPFLRYAIELPERIAETPLVLLRGLVLTRAGLAQGVIVVLLASAAGAGALLAASSLIRAEIGRRALQTLEHRILDGVASAPNAAPDGGRHVALLASDALAGQRSFLGGAIGTPTLAGGLLFGCIALLAFLDLRLALLAALGLAAFGWANALRMRLLTKSASAELAANEVLRRALSDLAGNLAAVAAHGTAELERGRIAAEMAPIRLPGETARRSAVLLLGATAALAAATVGLVLGAGAWFGADGGLSPGQVAAAAAAAALAVAMLDRLLRWRAELSRAAPLLGEVARQLGAFKSRRPDVAAAALPASGAVVADGVAVDGTLRGGRLVGLDLTLALPAHVGLVGDAESGARTFAALLGGQVTPRAGHITFGGVEIADADPAERAQKLAFCGGDTLLIANTLRANLLYGCRDPEAPDIEARIVSALEVAGLQEFVYGRGLSGVIDPKREPALAAAIVAARAGLRAELDRAGIAELVQPFDPDRYNPQATIGENILFGVSLGDTFREDHLATHPFMRSLLDREDLTATLAEVGVAIVRNDLEMFWGLPSRSAVVGRFSLLSGPEREGFEAILARQADGQRKAAAAPDTARLVGLAMRYSENRHRLGLVGPELETRLLRLRQAFAREIPRSLEPSIEFFRPDRLCAATSVLDNLLFGRIAEDLADARPRVLAAVLGLLQRLDLMPDILRVGLQTRIDPAGSALSPARRAAIDLARCLVRQPANLVVEHALDELPAREALALLGRLTRAMAGRGLVVVCPAQLAGAEGLFDTLVTFRAGKALPGASLSAGSFAAAPPPRTGTAARLPAPEPTWSPR
jgi:ABC-type multidrug transport system fused ATPase/permease subunit